MFIDYFYSDISNVVLDKGPLRSTLMLNLRFEGNDLVIEDIPNTDALEAFKHIREGIESGEENRHLLHNIIRSGFYIGNFSHSL